MKPLHSNVLIKVEKQETKVGGIVIPTDNNEKTVKAKVVGIGPKVECVEVGQIVCVEKESAISVNVNGETLYFVDDYEILGVES